MDGFDLFVEKVALHNKLVTTEQVAQAKVYQAKNPGIALLEILLRANLIKKPHADAIHNSYTQQTSAKISTGNTQATAAPSAPTAINQRMRRYLQEARQAGASDLHVVPNSPPLIRKNSRFSPLEQVIISPQESETLLLSVLDEAQKKRLLTERYIDTSFQISPQERARICFLKQKNGYDGAFRFINNSIKTPKELGHSEHVLTQLMSYHQGLVLVTGPSGCGKSTTVATMLEIVNQTRHAHIITLEDPIENVFVPVKSHFSQRQAVSHTASFSAALRAALREDPDVIMIGELRDLETASLAMTAAETGHLVISTLHTTSAVRTITRLLDMFPADQKSQVRMMLSESLRGIICQKLIPLKDGAGLTLASEILLNTLAIGALIRKEQFIQIPAVLQTGAGKGMRLMDLSIADLHKAGTISGEEAFFAADNTGPYQNFAPKDE